jgi:hypothetical protein
VHPARRAARGLRISVAHEAHRLVERLRVHVRRYVDSIDGRGGVADERGGNAAAHPVWIGEEVFELATDERREADDAALKDRDASPALDHVGLVDPELVRVRSDPLAVASFVSAARRNISRNSGRSVGVLSRIRSSAATRS